MAVVCADLPANIYVEFAASFVRVLGPAVIGTFVGHNLARYRAKKDKKIDIEENKKFLIGESKTLIQEMNLSIRACCKLIETFEMPYPGTNDWEFEGVFSPKKTNVIVLSRAFEKCYSSLDANQVKSAKDIIVSSDSYNSKAHFLSNCGESSERILQINRYLAENKEHPGSIEHEKYMRDLRGESDPIGEKITREAFVCLQLACMLCFNAKIIAGIYDENDRNNIENIVARELANNEIDQSIVFGIFVKKDMDDHEG